MNGIRHIDFERGKDPKRTMGIGIIGELCSQLRITQKELKHIFYEFLEATDAKNSKKPSFKDFDFAIYAIWDDPSSYDVDRDSIEYKAISLSY